MTELSIIEKVLADRADKPFVPTNDQKRAKARFWATFSTGGLLPPTQPSLSIAAQFAGDSRIHNWWLIEGFPQWFFNANEFSERVDYLAQVALDQLETLLTSSRVSDSAKVAAIKMALEVSKKIGQKSEASEFADAKIAGMDQGQLEQFIQSRIKLLTPA